MNSLLPAVVAFLAIGAAAEDVATNNAPDGPTQQIIQQAFARYTPAICLVNYSEEVTNRVNGKITKRDRFVLGLMVSPEGLVMAQGHMDTAERKPFNLKVTVGEDEEATEYSAVLLRKPDDINVAFLRIETEEPTVFPYIEFSAGRKPELGASMLLIGILGKAFDHARMVQTRRIGAVLDAPRRTYCLDQSVAFGNIGGPVVNMNGEAVGVLGFDLSSGDGGELYTRTGHPLLYQAELFTDYIENPLSVEDPEPEGEDAWIGVFTQPLTDDLAEYWGLEHNGGVVVSTVISGSPADRFGLRAGDVIVNFNGTPVAAKQDSDVLNFTKLVRGSPVDEPLPLRLYRDGVATDLELTLTTRPKSRQDAKEFEDKVFGLTVQEITQDVRIMLNLAEDVQGVIVRRVRQGSSANLARLRPGFIILSFGEHRIDGVAGFEAAVAELTEEEPAEITVFCRIGASTAFFRIQPRWEN